ncbi:MAG: hypothetical protein R6U13_14390 [Desulfatiglandaceae bacterium]
MRYRFPRSIGKVASGVKPVFAAETRASVRPALRNLVRHFMDVRPYVRFDQQMTAAEEAIPEPLNKVIYRISQEALNNISRHSNAMEVSLSLANKKNAIVLLICDNGEGFELDHLVNWDFVAKNLG